MNIQKLFKPYFVGRKNGQCQVFTLVELDELCEKIKQLVFIFSDIPRPTRDEVKETYDKPELREEIKKYYSSLDALNEFVWILMNKARFNGNNFDK